MQNNRFGARSALTALLTLAGVLTALAQGAPYVIRNVDFDVQGRSLAFVLKQKIEADGPVIGRSFGDRAALEAYVEGKRLVLSNNRVLASVETSLELSDSPAGGSDVALRFAVLDTWNLIVLPEPKYDSNKGLTLYLKGRDYNFVGSMQTLTLDLSYVSDTALNKSFEVATSFALPFQALGADWSAGVSEDFQAWTDGTLRSSSSASLTYNLTGLGFPASATATQGFYYNPDVFRTDTTQRDPLYLGEALALNASIPLGLRLGALGSVSYAPAINLTLNWWPATALQVYGRPGLSASASNALSSGRVDWIGNMRQGTSVLLSSTNYYNFTYADLGWDLSASYSGYWNKDRRLGLSARLSSRARVLGHFPADDYPDMGTELRGILDARAVGVAGLYANLSIPVKLFDFPAHIVLKKDWLDFELQAQPFVDAGIVLPAWGSRPGSDWLWTSGGLEFLVFPVAMRSFIVRASVGWDLKSLLQNRSLTAPTPGDRASPYEIYFGTGLAY